MATTLASSPSPITTTYQCQTLTNINMHLFATEYIPYLQNGAFFSIHALPHPSSLLSMYGARVGGGK